MSPDPRHPSSGDEQRLSENVKNIPGEVAAIQPVMTQVQMSSLTTCHHATKFRKIGAGFCGSVWAQAEEPVAFKREDGGPGRSLVNDYEMHKRVLKSREQVMGSSVINTPALFHFQIPSCYHFTNLTDSGWWDQKIHLFPPGFSPSNILCSERIPPLPQVVREALIEQYCPANLVGEIKASEANRDCLIRPYLGRRRQGGGAQSGRVRPFRVFSLRNFPLHLDQMEDLGLDIHGYAQTIAAALAMMHWCAEVDANDVEFVLAASRKEEAQHHTIPPTTDKSALGNHTMWILDFDCCREMSMDESGVDQAVAAFFRNDPFFPRPAPEDAPDQALWCTFRDRYLEISSKIMSAVDGGRKHLPKTFIEKIEGRQRELSAAKVKAAEG